MSTEPDTPPPGGDLLHRERRTLRSFLPVLAWLPTYRWPRIGADLIAGIAVAALLIPESMGYAGIAGAPAEFGLYAALGAIAAYAIAGGTSILVVGPASAVAALSASLIADLDGEPTDLVVALALASGVLLIAAGALRLGWIVNFISEPVLRAFVAGLSISIIIGQLDGLLGVDVEGESALAKLIDTISHLGDAHGLTTLLGVGAVVVMIVLERFAERVPAALVVVAAGIIMVALFDLSTRGVEIVGEIPTGLPSIGVPDLDWQAWLEVFGAAVALVLVGFSEGYGAASAVAAETGESIDGDQELIGSGAANIGAGLLGGIAVSGSLSKSAAAQNAGARSQMANVVAGVIVLATLLVLAPLFEDLPEPVLAAVVIVAVLRSSNPRRVVDLWRINRVDFIAGALTFTLVIVWETLPAMVVGVVLSLLFLVRRASFPDVVELGRDASDGSFRRSEPTTEIDDRSAVLRFEAPLIYANARRLSAAATTLLERREHTERLVLDAEMIAYVDSSGAEELESLDDSLADRGIELHIARPHVRVRQQLERSHLATRFTGRTHARVRDAL